MHSDPVPVDKHESLSDKEFYPPPPPLPLRWDQRQCSAKVAKTWGQMSQQP